MAKAKELHLVDLLVNTENYRFEPVGSQKEAINKMIEDQYEKLFHLAEHIVENGLNPNDKVQVIVSNHDKTKYNVVEGNRRTVALKLLNNPDLIESAKHESLKKRFKKLHEKHKGKIPKEVDCTIYDNPAEADKWIKLKHAGEIEGVGTVRWNAQQVQRFEEKVEGKSSIALQAIKILHDSPDVSAEMKTNLLKLKITNLDRLLSDPEVRKFLGIQIQNGIIQSEISRTEVVKGLSHIAKDLLDPKFGVGRIYTKDDRQDYIDKIPKSKRPDITIKASRPWQYNGTPAVQKQPTKPKPNPKERDTLIPKSCILQINSAKVNSIYHELQKLSVSKFTHAVAVSFRVFMELSLDCYLEKHKTTNANKDSKLVTKVTEVANHLEINQWADKHICKGIRSATSNRNDLLGIETWHAYVHNNKFSATAANLIVTWDNIQTFVERLWGNIK